MMNTADAYAFQTFRTIHDPSGNPRTYTVVYALTTWSSQHRGRAIVGVHSFYYSSPTQIITEVYGADFLHTAYDLGEVAMHKVGEWKDQRERFKTQAASNAKNNPDLFPNPEKVA